jgi:hypothetical protein
MLDNKCGSLTRRVPGRRPLQVLSHFGGEFERRPMAAFAVTNVTMESSEAKPTNITATSFPAMRGIGLQGYLGYELCHQLPVVDGQTVGSNSHIKMRNWPQKFMREIFRSTEGHQNKTERAEMAAAN